MQDFEKLKQELDEWLKQKEKELIAKRRKKNQKQKREA